MGAAVQSIRTRRDIQRHQDGTIHRWYGFVLGYPDHLIGTVLDRFAPTAGSTILDPFCGTGTTLVECKKRGLTAVGIDANPVAVLASRVKTNWGVDPSDLQLMCDSAVERVRKVSERLLSHVDGDARSGGSLDELRRSLLASSREGAYLLSSGMLERRWIDDAPFYVSIALLAALKELGVDSSYKEALKLALAACLVESVANVRFGPELYVVRGSGRHDVLEAFRAKVRQMVDDLAAVRQVEVTTNALVLQGDSRDCDAPLQRAGVESVDYVITSPPYPTEKDYTRNTRLELVYLGFVSDSQSLRRVKKGMIRSHSKGIYTSDSDGILVAHIPEIESIADELRRKVRSKTYGFAKLYPRIIEEYFGGMYRHLRSLARMMRPGGKAAFVVGDQRTYLQTYTPTGKLLAQLAELPEVGFRTDDLVTWRTRQGTTGSGDTIDEQILMLERL